MYREVIKNRKKELNVSAQWISEKADILDRTVKRLLSNDAPGETPDALFTNVSKVAGVLGLSLGDLDPKAAENFEGKLVKDFLADHKKLSEEYSDLKARNDRLKDENVRLNDKLALLEAELDHLRLTLAHKEENLAYQQQIMELQEQLLRLHKNSSHDNGCWKL